MEEIGFFGSKALVKLFRERKIESAIIYETMAYTDPAPASQSW